MENYRFYQCVEDLYKKELTCIYQDTENPSFQKIDGTQLYPIRKIFPETMDRFLLSWTFKMDKLGYRVKKY